MFKVHGYLDDERIINRQMEHLPRTGDTVRFDDECYGTITEVVWCFDEPSDEGQRINLRIKGEA